MNDSEYARGGQDALLACAARLTLTAKGATDPKAKERMLKAAETVERYAALWVAAPEHVYDVLDIGHE